MSNVIDIIALIAGIILPFWNIPLIVKIVKRGSSEDISVAWALGVWVCLVFMAPSAFTSSDAVWRIFNIVNLVIFTGVVIVVAAYRKGNRKGGSYGKECKSVEGDRGQRR